MSGPQDSAAPGARDPGPADTQADAQAAADTQAAPGAQAGEQANAETAAPGDAGPRGDAGPPGDARPRGGRRRKRKQRSFWRELPILIVVALLLAVVIKTFAIQAFWIPSGSMENTLQINDRVLVNKIVYHTRSIHRGDIVVFNGDGSWDPGTIPVSGNIFQQFADGFSSMFGFGRNGDILIKRVIGIPGDTVACCDAQGRVTVNGVPLTEQSYLYPGAAPSVNRFNIKVPSGRLWVMGDNRLYSEDSRDHQGQPGGGTIPVSAVIGRAFIIIWPPSHWRILPIPSTFTQAALNGSHAAAEPPAAKPPAAKPADPAVLTARAEPTGQVVPLALGFAGAVPLTWLQRRVRMRVTSRPQKDNKKDNKKGTKRG